MSFSKAFLQDGGSINIPPCFVGEHYDMQMSIESQGEEVYKSIKNDPDIPTTLINGLIQPKPKDMWNDDDNKKILNNKKSKNILVSSLGMDEFFIVSNSQTAKEIYDTLEVTHEGMNEVKISRLSTPSKKYEMFRMLLGEKIIDL